MANRIWVAKSVLHRLVKFRAVNVPPRQRGVAQRCFIMGFVTTVPLHGPPSICLSTIGVANANALPTNECLFSYKKFLQEPYVCILSTEIGRSHV